MFVTMIAWLTAQRSLAPSCRSRSRSRSSSCSCSLPTWASRSILACYESLHPLSLSVGVVGLIFCSMRAVHRALAICWITVALLATIGLPPEVVVVLDVLFRLFAVLALIAACVVMRYKGVVFSCTSQPGLKKARWLTCWVASDALTMGMGLLIVLSLVFQ